MHATPSRKSETTLGVQAYLTHISVVIHGIEEHYYRKEHYYFRSEPHRLQREMLVNGLARSNTIVQGCVNLTSAGKAIHTT